MATIKELKLPSAILPVLQQAGIKVRSFRSAKSFEPVLKRFLKRNNVLHLSTCRDNLPRTTPLEYRLDGFTFYILSEGGEKFNNLKVNKNVSFAIAEPYHPGDDFWGSKGLQAWGRARVYSRKTDPRRFAAALIKMKVFESLKKIGMKDLPPQFNYRVIEITPDRMRLGSLREGVYKVTWIRKG